MTIHFHVREERKSRLQVRLFGKTNQNAASYLFLVQFVPLAAKHDDGAGEPSKERGK